MKEYQYLDCNAKKSFIQTFIAVRDISYLTFLSGVPEVARD